MVDSEVLRRLVSGDGEAFREVFREYHPGLVRLARSFVGELATAEEVTQETWLAVIEGIEKFEGRASFKTWLFSILINKAKTRAGRDRRMVPFSPADLAGSGETVDAHRFSASGAWREPPLPWDDISPERIVAGKELWQHVLIAVDGLPELQRAVIVLRDIENVTAPEACTLLEVSEENQRVLLHRARSKIRRAVEMLVAQQKERE